MPPSWLQSHWAVLLPRAVASPSGQTGPEDALRSGWRYDSIPRLGEPVPGPNSSAEDESQVDLHPAAFPGQVCSWRGPERSKTTARGDS